MTPRGAAPSRTAPSQGCGRNSPRPACRAPGTSCVGCRRTDTLRGARLTDAIGTRGAPDRKPHNVRSASSGHPALSMWPGTRGMHAARGTAGAHGAHGTRGAPTIVGAIGALGPRAAHSANTDCTLRLALAARYTHLGQRVRWAAGRAGLTWRSRRTQHARGIRLALPAKTTLPARCT